MCRLRSDYQRSGVALVLQSLGPEGIELLPEKALDRIQCVLPASRHYLVDPDVAAHKTGGRVTDDKTVFRSGAVGDGEGRAPRNTETRGLKTGIGDHDFG